MERGLGVQVILSSFVRFQGRYLARDLRLIRSNNRELDIHLGTIESLPPADDNLFTPPQNAQRLPQRVTLAELNGANVTRIAGQYPERNHYPGVASGMYNVYIAALIHTDGTVGDVRVAGGPSVLRKVALNAVRTWKFRPRRLRHKPAEIEYPMVMQFKLYNR
jgi:outer membrane biosynthesis protein TonB